MAKTITTKKGDNGTTSLLGGEKLPKHHPRIEVIGSIDELNSYIGVIRSLQPPKQIDEILETLQHFLFIAGTDVASTNSTLLSHIKSHHLETIEKALETIESSLPDLSSFLLPGGSPISAHIHVARTLCRKVERTLSQLASSEPINPLLSAFFNRCSDLLFVLARYSNIQSGFPEHHVS